MVSEMEVDVTNATSCQRDFLWKEATEFLKGLENGRPPLVVIPQYLPRTPTVNNEDKGPSTRKRKASKEPAEKGEEKRLTTTNQELQQA